MNNPNNCQTCGTNPTTWAPQTELHLQGIDCGGNLADFVGKPGQIIQTVPKPGAVQAVKLCDAAGLPITTCLETLIAITKIWIDNDGIEEAIQYVYQDSCVGTITRKIYNKYGRLIAGTEASQLLYIQPIEIKYGAVIIGIHYTTNSLLNLASYLGVFAEVASVKIEALSFGLEMSTDSGNSWVPLTTAKQYEFNNVNCNYIHLRNLQTNPSFTVFVTL